MPSGDADTDKLYLAVRYAVRDAIWDVLGTIAMLGFILVLLGFGVSFASMGVQALPGTGGWLAIAFGVVMIGVAVLQFFREFELYPFDRETHTG